MLEASLESILAAFGVRPDRVERVPTGLIHSTFKISSGRDAWALQRVSSIFSPLVHEDIEAVTSHLESKGVATPRLRRTKDGQLWLARDDTNDPGVYRMLTWIDGRNLERLSSRDEARAAAALLGRFHVALRDLSWTFRARRLGVHDTPRHLAVLEAAMSSHADHRLFGEVAPIAREILASIRTLPPLAGLPERIVHGDPKITNVLFDPAGPEAVAMVDLDTVAPMALPLELGDAFRSWCNPAGEDSRKVELDLDIFSAALGGYASSTRGVLTDGEIEAVVPAIGTILLELSARFAADALNESYFGWNPEKHATRGDHNLLRAAGQLALAKDFLAKRSRAEAILRATYA
ncbi:MAG: phosphotransferase [Deltaproteobacteria bacterium]|nr:phosphotransferase [Deltaproteobacteria bacterium]